MEISTKRATIMVTDIVGYSALVEEDIRKAMAILEKNRKIHREAISKFRGKFIREVGDGILSLYENSIDAVKCAMEIHKTCCREASLQLRIGIHLGDIIIRYSEILGDGVNIARLIESSGIPGGIYLSEKAYEDVKHHKDIRAKFYIEKQLKNIPCSLRIYSIPTEKTKEKLSMKKSLKTDTLME